MKNKLWSVILMGCLFAGFIITTIVQADDFNKPFTPDENTAGLWRLNEGEGNVAADSTTWRNNGVFNGQPQWVDGKFGKAASFNGKDNWIQMPNNTPHLDGMEQITVEAWIYVRDKGKSGDWAKEMKNAQPDNDIDYTAEAAKPFVDKSGSYLLRIAGDAKRIEFVVLVNTAEGEKYCWALSNTEIETNTWYHLAGVYDGKECRIFINGDDDTQGNASPATGTVSRTNNPLQIGRSYGTRIIDGIVDEVRISNVARYGNTEEER